MEGQGDTRDAGVSGVDGDGVQTGQTGNACIVCWRVPTDRAHVIDRSLAPDPYADPLRTVFLCRAHHDAYDAHELDLLPTLERWHRRELARAVEVFGLVGTLERVTGKGWRPATPCQRCQKGAPNYCSACMTDMHEALGPEIVVNGESVGHGADGMAKAFGKMLDA